MDPTRQGASDAKGPRVDFRDEIADAIRSRDLLRIYSQRRMNESERRTPDVPLHVVYKLAVSNHVCLYNKSGEAKSAQDVVGFYNQVIDDEWMEFLQSQRDAYRVTPFRDENTRATDDQRFGAILGMANEHPLVTARQREFVDAIAAVFPEGGFAELVAGFGPKRELKLERVDGRPRLVWTDGYE